MALRVKQSLHPDGQHPLAFYIKCVPTVGRRAVVASGLFSPLTGI